VAELSPEIVEGNRVADLSLEIMEGAAWPS
jgi:hypothetical protein